MNRASSLFRGRLRLRVLLAASAALSVGVVLVQAISSSPSFATQFCNTGPIVGPVSDGPGSGIGPASPYPSAITVSGLTGTISDVNVTLSDFTAGYPDDADLLLSAPTGANAVIMSDAGGDNQNEMPISDLDLTLDDQAANPLPPDSQLASGTYRPIDDEDDANDGADEWPAPAPAASGTALSAFNGDDPNGTWNLWVTDDVSAADFAFESGWCIDILTNTDATTTTSTSTTTTSTSTTTTSTTSTTVVPPGDCSAVGLFIKSASWTVDEQQQVRVNARNVGTTPTRCRVTLFARRISPHNGPTAPDYPGGYVVTLNPGANALSYFYVTPPVPGTYRITGCARAINAAGVVNDSNAANDCRSARRTAS